MIFDLILFFEFDKCFDVIVLLPSYLQTRKPADEEDEGAESDADSINSEDFNSYLDKLSGSKNNADGKFLIWIFFNYERK